MALNILQVTPAFIPASGYGGGPQVVYELSRELVNRGHHVTVYTTDANNRESRLSHGIKTINEVTTHYFPNLSNTIAYTHKIFLSPHFITTLRRTIQEFDLIHIHDTRTLQSIVTGYYAAKHQIPYLLQPHGTLTAQSLTKQSLKKIFDLLFRDKILLNAKKLLLLNNTAMKKCIQLGFPKEKCRIIPNGIKLPLPFSTLNKGAFKDQYGITTRHLILYLGRIHASKGIELVLRAYKTLTRELDDITLAIVGPDDGYLNPLQTLISSLDLSEKIVLTGPVSEYMKFAAYNDADVFVTPRFTGFPLTFLEAMAFGVPIITTNIGDAIEGIHNVGFVIDYNPINLTTMLSQLLTDTLLRQQLSQNARVMVKDFDWKTIVTTLEHIYYQSIGS